MSYNQRGDNNNNNDDDDAPPATNGSLFLDTVATPTKQKAQWKIGDEVWVRRNAGGASTPLSSPLGAGKGEEDWESAAAGAGASNGYQYFSGIVAYLGTVSFTNGSDWVGVRLTGDSIGKGKNDGAVQGIRYFSAPPNSGLFVRASVLFVKTTPTPLLLSSPVRATTTPTTVTPAATTTGSSNRMMRTPPSLSQQGSNTAVAQPAPFSSQSFAVTSIIPESSPMERTPVKTKPPEPSPKVKNGNVASTVPPVAAAASPPSGTGTDPNFPDILNKGEEQSNNNKEEADDGDKKAPPVNVTRSKTIQSSLAVTQQNEKLPQEETTTTTSFLPSSTRSPVKPPVPKFRKKSAETTITTTEDFALANVTQDTTEQAVSTAQRVKQQQQRKESGTANNQKQSAVVRTNRNGFSGPPRVQQQPQQELEQTVEEQVGGTLLDESLTTPSPTTPRRRRVPVARSHYQGGDDDDEDKFFWSRTQQGWISGMLALGIVGMWILTALVLFMGLDDPSKGGDNNQYEDQAAVASKDNNINHMGVMAWTSEIDPEDMTPWIISASRQLRTVPLDRPFHLSALTVSQHAWLPAALLLILSILAGCLRLPLSQTPRGSHRLLVKPLAAYTCRLCAVVCALTSLVIVAYTVVFTFVLETDHNAARAKVMNISSWSVERWMIWLAVTILLTLIPSCVALMLSFYPGSEEVDHDFSNDETDHPNEAVHQSFESEIVPLLNGTGEDGNDIEAAGAYQLLEDDTETGDFEQSTGRIRGTRRLLQLAVSQVLYLYLGCAVLLVRLPFSLAIPHFVSTTLAALAGGDYAKAHREIITLLICGSIDAFLDFWCIFLFGYANLRIVRRVRLDLFQRLLHMEVAFFDAHHSGTLTSRLNSDCSAMASDLTWFFRFSIESVVRIVGIAIYMLIRSPPLAACALGIVPAVAVINKIYGDWLARNATAVQDALATTQTVAQEALTHIRTVISLGAESHMFQSYRDRVMKHYYLNVKQTFWQGVYYMVVSTFLINTIVQASLLWYGAYLISHDRLTADILLAFMLYQGQLQNETMNLFQSYSSLIKSSGAGDKVFGLLDRRTPPPGLGHAYASDQQVDDDDDNDDESNQLPLALAFERVTFRYPSRPEHKVLDGFDWKVDAGTTVALVGKSGSGKSTVLGLVQRLYDPSGGRVLVNGTDLRELNLVSYRKQIGVVTQDCVLFDGTVFENIVFGCGHDEEETDEEERATRVRQAAELANLSDFISALPAGYETRVGEGGTLLSGGEKQRLAIARAIYRNPRLLILDEATSSLDAASEALVQEALDHLLARRKGTTTLVVAHRLQTVQNADTICVMQDGKIVEQGTHQDLMRQRDGLYHSMVGRAIRNRRGTGVFRMPAEWNSHRCCLLLCPHNAATFRLARVRKQFLQVAQTIAEVGQEDVVLFCHSQGQLDEYRKRLPRTLSSSAARIHLAICDSNDSWARDTGPTFVMGSTSNSSGLQALDWDFNAYGGPQEGCYWPCEEDKLVARRMTQFLKKKGMIPFSTAVVSVPLVLEGGSIHTDGEGTILTTAECLLNPNRNPNMSKREIEAAVLKATGCTKMIWLDDGLAGDEDTNGHVDNWACFVRPGHIVLAWTDDETNHPENYKRCRNSLRQLQGATDAAGRSLTIHKLYLPSPMQYSQQEIESLAVATTTAENPTASPREVGDSLAASYVNFYIANRAVVVPQYGDPVFDAKALDTLRRLFPDRTVVGVQSREILIGGGNIHCITQQVPLVRS